MGLPVIREIMSPGMTAAMINPLQEGGDLTSKIYQMMEGLLLQNAFFRIEYGCPAVNLIEEMSPLNDAFKSALPASSRK